MKTLPEFRVTLTRLQAGEMVDSQGQNVPCHERLGQRSKFGGKPDRIQGEAPWPTCPHCKEKLTFVAQIDSVEHHCDSNPHSVDSLSEEQKWMFGDGGMIYVFFCFDCGHAEADTACY